MTLVLIRGTGEIGSAVAVALFRAGIQVVLHDRPRPSHGRRCSALTDALFEGRAALEGVTAKYARALDDLPYMLACGRAVPVTDQEFVSVSQALRAEVLVDARMRKHVVPEVQRGLATLTIGLGPNFVAGESVDLVVETAYGPDLGRVIDVGPSKHLVGDPQPLAGHGRERFVYAPVGGAFHTALDIGGAVSVGDFVGFIGDVPIRAPLSGWLRGLAHDGAEIESGAKIIEVDASAVATSLGRIGERPRRIAEAVVAAIGRNQRQAA